MSTTSQKDDKYSVLGGRIEQKCIYKKDIKKVHLQKEFNTRFLKHDEQTIIV